MTFSFHGHGLEQDPRHKRINHGRTMAGSTLEATAHDGRTDGDPRLPPPARGTYLTGHVEGIVEWAVAEACGAEDEESGDSFVVAPVEDGALLAVIDGVGKGRHAARAAAIAADVVRAHAGDPLPGLLQRCHQVLGKSRGATMTLAEIRRSQRALTWAGVGNVEGVLVRASRAARRTDGPLRLAGILGFVLPRVSPTTAPLFPGDVVVLATNGVAPAFADGSSGAGLPSVMAEDILRRHRRHSEALVLAAQFRP